MEWATRANIAYTKILFPNTHLSIDGHPMKPLRPTRDDKYRTRIVPPLLTVLTFFLQSVRRDQDPHLPVVRPIGVARLSRIQ